jgi:hypothetical protein
MVVFSYVNITTLLVVGWELLLVVDGGCAMTSCYDLRYCLLR